MLVIEDVVTSGQSVLGVVEQLHAEGLTTKHIVVLVDRELGATDRINSAGLSFFALFKITELFDLIGDKIEPSLLSAARQFILDNQLASDQQASAAGEGAGASIRAEEKPVSKMTYRERAVYARNTAGGSLFCLMEHKQTNLCVAIDTVHRDTLLQICDAVGPYVAVVKTHVDILEDWTIEAAVHLQAIAAKHNFLLFEDRKFADIGNTVERQFFNGPFNIESWASLVTAHALPGPGVIASLKSPRVGVFLLAQMSSQGALADADYSQKVIDMALAQPEIVVGLITKGSAPRLGQLFHSQGSGSWLIHATPGIQMAAGSGDHLGQQYNQTPESAVLNGTDLIIVGRGIVGPNLDTNPIPVEEMISNAKAYREAGWGAYLKRTQ